MITYIDLKNEINTRLRETVVPVNSRDVTEGFNRPSFFVQFENNNRSSTESQVYKSLTVQIYYFPKDRYDYSEDVLDMQEILENMFDLTLKVQDRLLHINEVNSMVVDGVLNFSFDLEFYEGREYEGEVNTIIEEIKKGKDFYTKYPIEKMAELELEKE